MRFGERFERVISSISAAVAPLRRNRVGRLTRTGDRMMRAGRWREAHVAYGKALSLDPKLAGIWVQYGHAQKEAGDRDRAEAAYRRAMSLGLDDEDIHLQLGHVLKLKGAKAQAERAYAEAFRRNPAHADVVKELLHLGWSRNDFRTSLPPHLLPKPQASRADRDADRFAAFDVSDILHHLSTSRRPTGIQRVQMHVIEALLAREDVSERIMLLCYPPRASYWVEIPAAIFRRVIELMRCDGSHEAPEWRALLGALTLRMVAGEDAAIPRGAHLVNLGSSWALSNYFIAVRRARAERGIVYVPFIHDCIPILLPQFFVTELQRDFREWVLGILEHADGFLANSRSTAADFTRIAAELAHREVSVAAIPLDATFSGIEGADDPAKGEDILRRNGLAPGSYVLLVSTFEPRKNHVLVFDAWSRMMTRRGAARVPKLVCVGGRGWRNEPIMQRLADSDELREKVLVLHEVSDAELDSLYAGCRFTVYPSRYEGWGLPVTEALSKGKAALVARTSSLPEAGLDLAEYFELDAQDELDAKLERLIDDDQWLARIERRIAQDYQPRSWNQIAADILDRAVAVAPSTEARLWHSTIGLAQFARLAKEPAGPFSSGVCLAERYRGGNGWGEREERACWLAGSGEALLQLPLSGSALRHDRLRLHMLIVGQSIVPGLPVATTDDDGRRHVLVVRSGGRDLARFRIHADQERWVMLELTMGELSDGMARLALEAHSLEGLRRPSDAVGIVALYLCGADDMAARARFLEGAMLGGVVEQFPAGGDARGAAELD